MGTELGGGPVVAIAFATASIGLLIFALWRNRAAHWNGPAETADVSDLRATMVQLQKQFDQLNRDLNGRVDAKINALKLLLREASDTIEQLRRLRSDDRTAPAETHGPTSVAMATPAAPPVEVSESFDPRAERYSHVYSLADAGLNPAEISIETGMHRGEVELVLSLRKKKYRVDPGGRTQRAPMLSSEEVQV